MPGHICSGQYAELPRVVCEAHNDWGPLGSLSLLHCHRIIHPLRFGGARWGRDDWTLADWCDQCHRKGGLVVWSNVDWSAEDGDSNGGEALANLILKKIDALEFHPDGPVEKIRHWHTLLNCGIQVPLVGCSAKEENNQPLGMVGHLRKAARRRGTELPKLDRGDTVRPHFRDHSTAAFCYRRRPRTGSHVTPGTADEGSCQG